MEHEGPQDTADRSGQHVAQRYELLERIGAGAMGSVYRAMHTELRKAVAVKILHPKLCRDEESVLRFQREAQAAAHLDHPHVCAATDFGCTDDGAFFLVMEFLEGEPLAQRLERCGALAPAEVVTLARQLVSALARAHALDIVHRDLKPDNVFLARRGDESHDRAKILDFGIASVHLATLEADDELASRATLSRAGAIYGTPRYLSPEQASGEPTDARSDLYSLGIMLYEMLAGQPPFVAPNTLALIGMHMTRVPEALPGHVPQPLCDIVMRLLEKDPAARFQSAGELGAALDGVADAMSGVLPVVEDEAAPGPVEGGRPLSAGERGDSALSLWMARLGRGEPRALGLTAAGALVLLVLGIVVGVAAFGSGEEDVAAASGEAHAEAAADATESAGMLAAIEPAPVLETQEDVQGALQLLEDGFVEAGLSRLSALEASYGELAAFWRLLHEHQLAHGEDDAAMASLERLVAIEPAALDEDAVLGPLLDALEERRGKAPERAAALLAEHMNPSRAEALAERAAATKSSRVRRRIVGLLEQDDWLARLDEWLRLSVELRNTSRGKCRARKEIVERLIAIGDARALAAIEAVSGEPSSGCGVLDLSDCSECMRGTLREARKALAAEASP